MRTLSIFYLNSSLIITDATKIPTSTAESFEVDNLTAGVDVSSSMIGNLHNSEPRIEDLSVVSQGLSTLLLQGTKSTQSRCFICHSKNGRKGLPWAAVQQAWFEMRCFIPKTNRTCDEHLTDSNKFTDDALRMIGALMQNINVRIPDFQSWLNAVSDLPKSTPYNFEVNGIEAEKYKMLLGIDKESFDDLLQYLKGSVY